GLYVSFKTHDTVAVCSLASILVNQRYRSLLRKSACALLIVCSLSISSMTQAPGAAKSASLDERLGQDDGAALALLIGANMRGNMEVCDCTHPRGSLPRRVGYLDAFRKKFKETPVLQVEAGNWTYDSTGYLPAVMLQNEQ